MAPSLEPYTDAAGGEQGKTAAEPIGVPVAGGAGLQLDGAGKHDLVLAVFRAYIADLCEQFKGGHPGSAMGMAAIGVALYKYVLRYSPRNCDYFNRDRFVLSNGRPPRPLSSTGVTVLLISRLQDTHACGSIFSCTSSV